MDKTGALLTNEWLETSEPDILAAGDSAAITYNPLKQDMYIPLASNAVKQGTLRVETCLATCRSFLANKEKLHYVSLTIHWQTRDLLFLSLPFSLLFNCF